MRDGFARGPSFRRQQVAIGTFGAVVAQKRVVALEVAGAAPFIGELEQPLVLEFYDAAAHALEPGVAVAAINAQVYDSVRFQR